MAVGVVVTSNQFVLSHYVSLLIIGLINLALMVLGIVIVNKPLAKFGPFEFMAIAANLICGASCLAAAYSSWRNPCSPG